MIEENMNIKQFTIKYHVALIFTFLFTLLIYSSRLIFFSLSIDTEVLINSYHNQMRLWIGIGRFSLAFLKYIFSFIPYNYYLSVSLMLLFFSLAIFYLYFIIYRYSNIKSNNIKIIIFSCLITSSPIIAEQFYFTLQCAEIALCFLIFDLALYLFLKGLFNEKFKYILLSTFFFAFCYGAYQSFIVLMISMLVFILLLDYKNDKKIKINVFLKFSFIYFLLSLSIYSLINNITLMIFSIPRDTYIYDYILWGKLPISTNIKQISISLFQIFCFNNPYYQFGYIMLFIILFKDIIKNKNNLLNTVLDVLFALSPFITVFLLAQAEPIRAQIARPIVVALGIVLLLKKQSKLLIVMSILLIISQSFVTMYFFYESHQVYERDKKLATTIIDRIHNNPKNKKVVFIGQKKNLSHLISSEAIDSSFFEWDGASLMGINYRAIGFLKYLKYNVEYLEPYDYENANDLINIMGFDWNSNEIKIYENNDTIIIRLFDKIDSPFF